MKANTLIKQFEELPTPELEQKEKEIDILRPEAQKALRAVLSNRRNEKTGQAGAIEDNKKPGGQFLARLLWFFGYFTIAAGFIAAIIFSSLINHLAWEVGLFFYFFGLINGLVLLGISQILKNQLLEPMKEAVAADQPKN